MNDILTWKHLKAGDMLYVAQPSAPYYLIFVQERMDWFEFIRIHRGGHFFTYRMPKESVCEGDALIEDSGWEIYRPDARP